MPASTQRQIAALCAVLLWGAVMAGCSAVRSGQDADAPETTARPDTPAAALPADTLPADTLDALVDTLRPDTLFAPTAEVDTTARLDSLLRPRRVPPAESLRALTPQDTIPSDGPAAGSQRVNVQADSLSRRTDDGLRLRELIGDVFVKQDSTRLRSIYAIQYLARDEFLFTGDVVIFERGDTLYADTVRYDRRSKVGRAFGNVQLTDGDVDVYAPRAIYYSEQKLSIFPDSVVLVDDDRTLTARYGEYYSDDNRAEFADSVRVRDPDTYMEADSVTYYRDDDRSVARGNVFIDRTDREEAPDAAPDEAAESTTDDVPTGPRADAPQDRPRPAPADTLRRDRLDQLDRSRIDRSRIDSIRAAMGRPAADSVQSPLPRRDTTRSDTTRPDTTRPDTTRVDTTRRDINTTRLDTTRTDSLRQDLARSDTSEVARSDTITAREPALPPDTTGTPDTAIRDTTAERPTQTYLFGDRAVNEEARQYSQITGNALLVQVRADSTGAPTDTLLVRARRLEATRTDTLRRLIAVDSVRIWQSDLAAVADSVVYDRFTPPDTADAVTPPREETRLFQRPMAWFEDSQVSGDTLRVSVRNRSIDTIFVRTNAFAAQRDSALDRIQQLKGRDITAFFRKDSLQRIVALPNARAIRYLEGAEGERNGAARTSADRIVLRFRAGEVRRVSVIGGTETKYYKESILPPDFSLEGFVWSPDRRPLRDDLLRDERVRRRLAPERPLARVDTTSPGPPPRPQSAASPEASPVTTAPQPSVSRGDSRGDSGAPPAAEPRSGAGSQANDPPEASVQPSPDTPRPPPTRRPDSTRTASPDSTATDPKRP
jgi:lipopolysaccharide export system protein LptA